VQDIEAAIRKHDRLSRRLRAANNRRQLSPIG